MKEYNKRKDREKRELEDRKRFEEEEIEKQKQLAETERRKVFEDAASKARLLITGKIVRDSAVSEDCFDDVSDDSLLAHVAGKAADPEAKAGYRALVTAMKHKSWLEARS